MSFQPRTQLPALPPLLKHLNERTVLEAIRSGAPISRAEISRRAGISKPTVSLALQSLLEAGLVREASDEPRRPAIRRGLLRARARGRADASVSTSAGASCAARSATSAATSARGSTSRSTAVTPAGVLDQIAELRAALVAASGLDDALLNGAVVGIPGVVDAGAPHDLAGDERRRAGRRHASARRSRSASGSASGSRTT